ncbi:MAG TPA: hypothetical protein VMU93_02390 [Caulobacteraceae bacterium]|nr:hypothetical protein [Caulobacteraceae bacterium]
MSRLIQPVVHANQHLSDGRSTRSAASARVPDILARKGTLKCRP